MDFENVYIYICISSAVKAPVPSIPDEALLYTKRLHCDVNQRSSYPFNRLKLCNKTSIRGADILIISHQFPVCLP